MEHERERELPLIEAIEVCRPRSDDVSLPELQALKEHLASNPELKAMYHRLQELDGRIGRAFRAVDVPDGLADRILDRLREAGHSSPAQTPGVLQPQESHVATAGRVRRRWLIGAAASVAAAAAVIVAGLIATRHDRPVTGADVWRTAMAQFDRDSDAFNTGLLLVQEAPPAAYPVSSEVILPAARWRWVDGLFLGRKAVAYDISLPAGGRATLYVLKAPSAGLPTAPPSRAEGTGNKSVAAWNSGDLVYVLVLDQPNIYPRLLAPRGPIT
jgi:hypothetical protein